MRITDKADRAAKAERVPAILLEGLFADRRLAEQLAFIIEGEQLESILRRTSLIDRFRRENDAEHTWQLALMAMVLAEHADEKVDLVRVRKMILIREGDERREVRGKRRRSSAGSSRRWWSGVWSLGL